MMKKTKGGDGSRKGLASSAPPPGVYYSPIPLAVAGLCLAATATYMILSAKQEPCVKVPLPGAADPGVVASSGRELVSQEALPGSVVDPEKVFLTQCFEKTEKEFQKNLQNREDVMKDQPGVRNATQLREIYLVPLYSCCEEARLGPWGEGGKWVCLSAVRDSSRSGKPVAVSIGCNGDSSFEAAMDRRLNVYSHTFDFTLSPATQQKMEQLPFMKFYNAGLAGATDIPVVKGKYKRFANSTIVTVVEMLEMIGEKYIDYFKIDCEGCEFGLVDDFAKTYTRENVPFGQIQMELHAVYDSRAKDVLRLIRTLESLGFRMFHSEINSYYLSGFELAFVHERMVKASAVV